MMNLFGYSVSASELSEWFGIFGTSSASAFGIVKLAMIGYRKIDAVFSKVNTMSAQIFPNGGSSLRDAVDGIQANMKKQDEMLIGIRQQLVLQNGHARLMQNAADFGVLEFDNAGKLLTANHAFCQTTKTLEGELVGTGWLNIIDDSESVALEFGRAIASQSIFVCRLSMTLHDDTQLHAKFSSFAMGGHHFATITFGEEK